MRAGTILTIETETMRGGSWFFRENKTDAAHIRSTYRGESDAGEKRAGFASILLRMWQKRLVGMAQE